MMKRLITATTTSVTSAAVLVGFFSVLSRFIGLVRDRVLVQVVGVSDTLDAYYSAFRIPDILFQLLVMGTLSASFIPIFLKYWDKNNEKAWRYTNAMLTYTGGAFAVIALLCALGAPYIASLVGVGFSPDKQALVANMLRVILISQCFFAVSMVFGSVLQATRRFFIYSLAPIVYNVGIILGAVFLVPLLGPWGIAWGTVLGAAMHAVLQAIGVFALGFSPRPVCTLESDVKNTLLHMGPRTVSLAIAQLNFLFMTTLATTLASGSVTMLQFAYNLNYFPIGIIAVSYAIAAFPAMCDAVRAPGEASRSFKDVFSSTVRQLLFLMIPATVLFLLLRAQIVRLVLGTQNFSWDATVLTANVLAVFALSFCAQGLIYVLVRGFFAMEKTAAPVFAAVCGAVCNIVLALVLTPKLGLIGLVGAFSISAVVQCAMLWALLRVSAGKLGGRVLTKALLKMSTAAVCMAGGVQIAKYVLAEMFPLTTFMGVLVQLLGASAVGGAVYVGVSLLLKNEECIAMLASVRAKMLRAATPKEVPAIDGTSST
ncbi:murein biosynthesis integral membrane protein MurJ [bacterium]|nr:murein biosynthesis integral membrane protein MurJ [bacterium]NBX49496.1 murein biosynthesis integral membrane protein MurJ [bacterium]